MSSVTDSVQQPVAVVFPCTIIRKGNVIRVTNGQPNGERSFDISRVKNPTNLNTLSIFCPERSGMRQMELTSKQLNLVRFLSEYQEKHPVQASKGVQDKTDKDTARSHMDRIVGRSDPAPDTNGIITGNVERMEERIAGMQKVVDCNDYYMLHYLIGEPVSQLGSGDCPNPSGPIRLYEGESDNRGWVFPGLWWFGFWFDGSGWVLPKESLDHPDVQRLLRHWARFPITQMVPSREMQRRIDEGLPVGDTKYVPNGVRVDIVRYHPDDVHKVREICRARLEEYLRAIDTSLTRGMVKAMEDLAREQAELDRLEQEEGKTVTHLDREKLEKGVDSDFRRTVRTAGERLNAAIQCSRLFQEEGNVAHLIQALRETVAAQKETANARLRSRGVKTIR
jgi:hypothetical protein